MGDKNVHTLQKRNEQVVEDRNPQTAKTMKCDKN